MEDLFKQINQEKIAQYQAHLEKLDLSEATIKRRLSALRKFYNWAEKEGYLEKPPQKAPIAKEAPSKLRPTLPSMPTIPFISDAYEVYHSISITKYLHYAILIVFCVALGMGIYNQLTGPKAELAEAYPTALTRPNRYLSFQGRLTDSSNNPITTSTSFTFKLYDAVGTGCPPTGGTELWSGSCSIDPDQDGIFSVLLGSDCGSEIASSVFSENAGVWLQVQVSTETLCPRIQVATVGYALNAETLQGYPPGTATSTVPYIDSTGKVVIAAASPTVQATSGTFSIEGQTGVTVQAASGQNGNITLSPKGTGRVILSGFEASTGNLFDVQGGANLGGVGGKEANTIIYGYAGTNSTNLNLLKLEAGTPVDAKFTVDASGNASAAGYLRANTTGSYFTGDVTVSGGTITGANSEQVKIGVTNDTIEVVRGASTYTVCDSSGNCVGSSAGIGGSGTANRVAKFTDTYTIGNSGINDLSDALAITIDSSERVGIGTTNPSKKLHVAGECVAEDSLVPVKDTPLRQGVSLVEIKDIKPGNLVLSLNESTGKFQWQKVEKTLDKGIQEVYELVTESNKRIETTGNHPYLARNLLTSQAKENQITSSRNQKQSNDNQINISFHNSPLLFVNKINSNQDQTTYNGSEKIGISDIPFNHRFASLANSNEIAKNNPAITNDTPNVNKKSNKLWGRANKGEITPAENQATAILPKISEALTDWPTDNPSINNHHSTDKDNNVKGQWIKVIYLRPGMEIAVTGSIPVSGSTLNVEWEKIVSIQKTGTRHVYDLQIENTYNFVANGIVAHNTYINSSSANALLVENAGTYNSILSVDGSTGRVGIGTTSPGDKLDVNGHIRISGGVGYGFRFDTATGMYLATGTGYNYNINFQTNSINRVTIQDTGNVGIGTTSPGATLDINGNLKIGTLASGSTDNVLIHSGNIIQQRPIDSRVWGTSLVDYSGTSANYIPKMVDADTITDSVIYETGGNIGIGTTNPGTYKLNVAGTAAFNNAGVTIDSSSYVNAQRFVDIGSNYYLDPAATGNSLLVAGNVGIGTTGPEGKLHLVGGRLRVDATTDEVAAAFVDSGLAGSLLTTTKVIGGAAGSGYAIYSNTAIPLTFGTNNAEHVRITSTGNVGIGTAGPDALLDIRGASSDTDKVVLKLGTWTTDRSWQFTAGKNAHASYGDYPLIITPYSLASTGDFVVDIRAGDVVLQPISGNVGIGTTDPGYKLEVAGTAQFDNAVYFANGTTYYVDASGNAKFLDLIAADTGNPGLTVGDGTTGYVKVGGSTISDAAGDLTLNSDSGNVTISDANLILDDGSSTSYYIKTRSTTSPTNTTLYINNPGTGNANLIVEGDLTVTGNDILDAGGSSAIIFDGAQNTALAGNLTMQDDKWIGLGSSAGRIEFDGTPATDEVNILDANVGIGTTNPETQLHLTGNLRVGGSYIDSTGSYGLDKTWTTTADFNASGTTFSSGMLSPATNNELKLATP